MCQTLCAYYFEQGMRQLVHFIKKDMNVNLIKFDENPTWFLT